MRLLRIGVIAGAHGIVIAIVYLMSGFGNGGFEETRVSVAGANGIVNWSNQDPNALSPTVTGTGFDSRASDLAGYNAGDPSYVAQTSLPEISSRQRFEPRRPGESDRPEPPAPTTPSRSQTDSGVLQPLGRGTNNRGGQPENIIAPSSPSQIIRYTVRSGDSIWGISQKFGVSQQDLQSVNPGLTINIQPGQILNVPRQSRSPEPVVSSSSRAPQVDGSTYIVKSGDSLSKIAANQGVTLNALRAANGLSGDLIRVGQKLIIPNNRGSSSPPTARRGQGLQVVVAPGDTISSIALRYNVSARDLILRNNIQNPARITPGQTLFIPSTASRPPEQRPSTQQAPSAPKVEDPKPETTQPAEVIPEDPPLILPDEDDILLDEELIEQPVIPIEN